MRAPGPGDSGLPLGLGVRSGLGLSGESYGIYTRRLVVNTVSLAADAISEGSRGLLAPPASAYLEALAPVRSAQADLARLRGDADTYRRRQITAELLRALGRALLYLAYAAPCANQSLSVELLAEWLSNSLRFRFTARLTEPIATFEMVSLIWSPDRKRMEDLPGVLRALMKEEGLQAAATPHLAVQALLEKIEALPGLVDQAMAEPTSSTRGMAVVIPFRPREKPGPRR